MNFPPGTAAHAQLAQCHVCLKLSATEIERCPRCQTRLHSRTKDSLQWTLALLITALILFVPANVLPITTTLQPGGSVDSTIVGGVQLLWNLGSYPVAAIIFIYSIVIPLGKFIVLGYLCWSVHRGHRASMRERTILYRVAEFIGRWSMMDVFVVAILVALIQLGNVLTILPGFAALAFAGVVIATMIAAEQFDTRLIWDQEIATDE